MVDRRAPIVLIRLIISLVLAFMVAVPAISPAVHAESLSVPVIAQRFSPAEPVGSFKDSGAYNCLPASVAMALQALLPDEMSDEGRYRQVRQAMRADSGGTGTLNVEPALELIPGLTNNRIDTFIEWPGAEQWQAMVQRELQAGYPVLANITKPHLLASGQWFANAHMVVIVGLENGVVSYNDPWVARTDQLDSGRFAQAWGDPHRAAVLFRRVGDTLPTEPQTPVPVSPVPTVTPTIPSTRTPVPLVPTTVPVTVPTIAPLQDPSTQPPESDPPESENGSIGQPGTGHVSFLALRCPANEGLVIADPATFDIGMDCPGWSEKTFLLLIIDEAGNESTIEFIGSAELTLPYGIYEIVNPATGEQGTLSLIPNELYEKYCAGADVCIPTWQVVIRSSLHDEDSIGETRSDMATVVVSGLECTGYEPGIYAIGPTQNNPTPDLWNCSVSDEPVSLHVVDQNGDEQIVEVQGEGPTSFELPFGTYDIAIIGTELATTLSIQHDPQYDAACGGTADCPYYWLVEYNLPPSDTGLNGLDSTDGSVTVSLYQCPSDVTPYTASPATCQAGNTGSLELYFWNPEQENGQFLLLEDARKSGDSYTWTASAPGTYILAPEWGAGLVGSIYVPGLESFDDGSATVDWDDTTFPATPDYTVSSLSGTGYWVPVTTDVGDLTLDVYVFGPECWEEPCENDNAISSTQGSSQANDPSSVEDTLIAEAIERFGGEWTGTFYQSNPTREWPVRITYWGGPEGTVVGSIEYLPNVCKADLIQLQMVLDFGLSLREEVTIGKENCLSGGTINLDGNSSGLTFTWTHPASDATGHGTLQKVGSAQPLESGTGSLEIHAVTCPPGYTGTDYYSTCHSNGEAFAAFIVDGGGTTLSITTQIHPATGTGVATLDALIPGSYYIVKYTDGIDLPAFVFCSPDQGATTIVSQYIASGEGLNVPIDGQALVCDWYSLP